MGRQLRRLVVMTVVVVSCLCALAGRVSHAASSAPPCSVATAKQLIPDTVSGVSCGAFAGPGSQVMLVNFSTGVCMPFVGWDLYRLQGGAWKRITLPDHGGLTGTPATPSGTDIRETIDIRRPGDLVCNPKGGTKTRVWHWNGSTFVAGAWTYSKGAYKPSKSSGAQTGTGSTYIASPTGNIECTVGGATTYCQTFKPDQNVHMDRNGKLDICHHTKAQGCAGNAGEGVHWHVVAYGNSFSRSGVRCSSAFSGMTCVLTATGKGFTIARSGIKPVG